MARRRVTVLVAVVSLLGSACGSTVQWSEQIPAGGLEQGGPADEFGTSALGIEGGTGTADEHNGQADAFGDGAGKTGRPGQGPESRLAGSGAPLATPRPGTPLATPRPGTRGRGFTAKEIFIGYPTGKDVSSTGKQIGAGMDYGDQEAMAKAVVNDINRRGGVAGRQLTLVFHDAPTASVVQDPNGAAQRACVKWTEDRPVFAVISMYSGLNNDTLFSCLAKRQTPIVVNDVGMHAAAQMSRYAGYFYAPSVPALERVVPTWMSRLAPQGYFGQWDTLNGRPGNAEVKIGLLYSDSALYGGGQFAPIVERALGKHGRTIASKFKHSGDLSTISSEMSRAVLQFQRAGVTHVIGDALFLFFMQAADSQNYRPRYTLTSFSGPTAVLKSAPPRQLNGATGVGYAPTGDVTNEQDPGDVSAAQSRCREVMKDAGEDPSNRQAMLVMVLNCDALNFFVKAVDEGGLSPAGMQKGAASINSLAPSATFGISFAGSRPDGASTVRDLRWNNGFYYPNSKNYGM